MAPRECKLSIKYDSKPEKSLTTIMISKKKQHLPPPLIKLDYFLHTVDDTKHIDNWSTQWILINSL